MPKPSKGYVYVASIVNNPCLSKIGYTRSSPSKRVSELSREYKNTNFELYCSVESDRPARHESMTHEYLNSLRVDREIFNISPRDAKNIINLLSGKWFTITSADNLKGFNCIGGDDLFYACKSNPIKASVEINKLTFELNIRGVNRLGSNFDLFVSRLMEVML